MANTMDRMSEKAMIRMAVMMMWMSYCLIFTKLVVMEEYVLYFSVTLVVPVVLLWVISCIDTPFCIFVTDGVRECIDMDIKIDFTVGTLSDNTLSRLLSISGISGLLIMCLPVYNAAGLVPYLTTIVVLPVISVWIIKRENKRLCECYLNEIYSLILQAITGRTNISFSQKPLGSHLAMYSKVDIFSSNQVIFA